MTPRPVEDDAEEVEEIGLDPSPSGEEEEGEEHHGATKLGVGGYEVAIDNNALPYIGIVLSAVVLLIAVVVPVSLNKNEGYGIAVAVVSMVFGLLGVYMAAKNSALYEKPIGSFPYLGDLTLGSALAQFLFLWNFIAAGVLTFAGPFTVRAISTAEYDMTGSARILTYCSFLRTLNPITTNFR